MSSLKHLLEKNKQWASGIKETDPEFFNKLSTLQEPEYLWIGCSDSRVPANQIMGLLPGEVFVHRNVANIVVHSDMNCLSSIQFAVEVLKVKHIIVTGHYGCGGVHAALNNRKMGLVDNWLRHIQDIKTHHEKLLLNLDKSKQWDRLCELNVIEQAFNVMQTTTVRDAWANGQDLTVHGWCYSLKNGIVTDMEVSASNNEEATKTIADAIMRMEA